MPLVRIDISRSASLHDAQAVGEVVYDAMVKVANVPPNDKFQVITRHEAGEVVYPADGYLGIQYSPSIVIIQVTWNAGRSIEVKKAFYAAVANGVHEKTGIRKEDVFINLVDVARENWSFGNGEMQYAPTE
ncbi:tautomerase family protein [Paraburkholderia sp. DHOC27]|uniref:tautomerase family protein n=1 Tax=Paraburkholderia sp. DHOC27 TaxID=2303330 RepID=UPI000E3C4613|nr:tautomerase family protein [Paraburkholderia sp. DHOC27]RFU45468.1 tautomerase family protein [Paraburkholderia sp. DHOC27]